MPACRCGTGRRCRDYDDPRYTDYARANASIGINGAVLNNVNAKRRHPDRPPTSPRSTALADIFRPYGIRVYLAARFSARRWRSAACRPPTRSIRAVRAWWRAKADEIYALIPDFGGFLVKANSEGQPGPQDYRPQPCRRRQHDGRSGRAARRHRHMARLRLFERRGHRPRRAGL